MGLFSPSIDVATQQRKVERRRAAIAFRLALLSSAMISGCGAEEASRLSRTKYLSDQSADKTESATSASPSEKAGESGPTPAKAAKAAQKIIYDARIELQVDSLNATEQAILKLVKQHDGFLAESDQSSLAQNQRHASWRVRIPAANFEAFVGEVVRLGEVRQNHVGSQDITEQYLDLEARIRNKREEEKRLLKHLADSTGKLEDILAVERELSRVRGEAEQMEGRLRFLADRSELSTVTIEANEWKDYKPPVAATFGTQVKRAFFTSVERLVEFGKGLAILVVVLAPWVPLMLLGLVLVRLLIRYAGRTSRPGPPRAAPVLTPRPEGRP